MLSARGAIYDSGTQLAAPQGYDARTHGAVVELMITIIQGPAVEPQVPVTLLHRCLRLSTPYISLPLPVHETIRVVPIQE